MDDDRRLLCHFLAAIAYRTQKAVRDAPADFADFRAAPKVRTPLELIRHMDSVLGYSRTFFIEGAYRPPVRPDFAQAVEHFHETLADIAGLLASGSALREITPEQLLQGPFSDAMTHAGQLALLRRLSGSPVASENFVFARVTAENLGPVQPLPVAPDKDWTPLSGQAELAAAVGGGRETGMRTIEDLDSRAEERPPRPIGYGPRHLHPGWLRSEGLDGEASFVRTNDR